VDARLFTPAAVEAAADEVVENAGVSYVSDWRTVYASRE